MTSSADPGAGPTAAQTEGEAAATRRSTGADRADTIPALLAVRQAEDPDVPMMVSDDEAITFAQLNAASRDLAARLVAAGVNKGDRVGLLMPNGIDWAVKAMAVVRIGAVLVPLSTLLRPPELRAQLDTVAVTHLVTARRFRNRQYLDDLTAAGAPKSLRRVWAADESFSSPGDPVATTADGPPSPSLGTATNPAPGHLARSADGRTPTATVPAELVAALEATVRPADDLVVLFTSGSRGAPKGTIHTHGSALRAVRASLSARCVGPGERLYIPMPFFWTGGFCGGLLSVLVAGATLLTESDPEPGRTLRMLERERVTMFRGWPDQATRMAAHPDFATTDLSSLKAGSLPGVLPADQRPAPGARANLFGMTESCGPYCGAPLDTDLPPSARGSCGRPFAGIDLRISEPESEIWLRGPNMLRGICGRDRSTVFTPEGFYRTGDLGRLDGDGYLWFDGRLDDMFKVSGATVYPSEVEAALRSVPGVSQAFATDVDGEVAALVVTALEPAALRAAARERLSAFKVPTRWLLTTDASAVPLLPTAKVDKPALQALLATRDTPAAPSC